MEFSILDNLSRAGLWGIILIFISSGILFYLALLRQPKIIMILLVISASFVGSMISIIGNVAPFIRWLSLSMLLACGLLKTGFKASWGLIFFWLYVFMGFFFLFRSLSPGWQIQRAFLLLMVALAVPLAYTNSSFKSIKSTLYLISFVAGGIFFMNLFFLGSELDHNQRFSGLFRAAPTFTIALASLLPFTLWGVINGTSKFSMSFFGLAFLVGIFLLLFSGQRAGTIGGLLGTLPLFFTNRKNNSLKLWGAIGIILALLGYGLSFFNWGERLDFLFDRYSLESGLSGRSEIWKDAFAYIYSNPLLGRGIGAAEVVMDFSFHNTYLEIWFNAGFLGLILFLSSQIFFLYKNLFMYRYAQHSEVSSFCALSLGYMIGFIFISIFESTGAGASNLNLILYLFFGVTISGNLLTSHEFRSKPRHPSTKGEITS